MTLNSRSWSLGVSAVVFVLVFLAGVSATNYLFPKVYGSSAIIQIARDYLDGRIPGIYAADLASITSQRTLLPVINRLKLAEKWSHFDPELHGAPMPEDQAVLHLVERLRLDPIRGTILLKITAFSDQPLEAADIANGIADEYRDADERGKRQQLEQGKEALRLEIENRKKAVEEAELLVIGLTVPPHSGDNKPLLNQPTITAYQQAQHDLKEEQDMLKALTFRYNEFLADERVVESSIKIISRAEPPTGPLWKNQTLGIGLSFLLAVASGVTVFRWK